MIVLRLLGGLAAAVPLGVLVTLGYLFGRDAFGDQLYGALMGVFGIIAALSVFSLADAVSHRHIGRAVCAVLVIAVAVVCSAATSAMTLGAKQQQLLRAGASAADLDARIASLRRIIAAPGRDEQTIKAEIAERQAEARAGRRSFPLDARIALQNELGRARQTEAIRRELASLELARSTMPATGAADAIAWLGARAGQSPDAVGSAVMVAYVLASEIIGGLGLFVTFGGHAPRRQSPSDGGTRVEAPDHEAPAQKAVTPVKLEVVRSAPAAAAPTDAVRAFVAERLRPCDGARTAYLDIQAAWSAWCAERGVNAAAINLGSAIRAAGYSPSRGADRRTAYQGVALAA